MLEKLLRRDQMRLHFALKKMVLMKYRPSCSNICPKIYGWAVNKNSVTTYRIKGMLQLVVVHWLLPERLGSKWKKG